MKKSVARELLKLKLIKKLDNEFLEYKESVLKNYTPKQIVEKAYEIAVKEQIKDEIIYKDLSKEQIRALLKSDDILDEFYNDWIDEDSRLGEILENSIDTTLDIIEANFNKIKSNRDKER